MTPLTKALPRRGRCRGPREPSDREVFLQRWAGSPARMGAIAPSSPWLARAVSASVPERGDPVVIELGPGTGSFAAFTYLHAVPLAAARRFRALLADRFEEVIASRTIWRNTPPAFVLHARRPRP